MLEVRTDGPTDCWTDKPSYRVAIYSYKSQPLGGHKSICQKAHIQGNDSICMTMSYGLHTDDWHELFVCLKGTKYTIR